MGRLSEYDEIEQAILRSNETELVLESEVYGCPYCGKHLCYCCGECGEHVWEHKPDCSQTPNR